LIQSQRWLSLHAIQQFEAVAASQIVKAFPGNVFFSRGGGIESLSDGNDESLRLELKAANKQLAEWDKELNQLH
jgi:hypothetical protein